MTSATQQIPTLAPHYDVVIVGAGIAGCALAQALALADQSRRRSILIIDLHHGVNPRFSGEFIHPRGAQVLDDLGFYRPLIQAGALDVDGFVVFENAGGRRVELNYPSLAGERSHGLAVHHKTLVQVMRQTLVQREQVKLLEGWRVVELLHGNRGVRGVIIEGRDEQGKGTKHRIEVASDLVVAADGKASPTRKLAGIADQRHSLGFTIGIELENPVTDFPLHANVILGATGPILCYPILRQANGALMARLTFDLPHALPAKGAQLTDYLLKTFVPYLPEALARQTATVLRSERSLEMAPTINLPAPPATMPGLILVGDAAGCSHPITASGMTMGLLDAKILGKLASERAHLPTKVWLSNSNLRRFRTEHDRYVPTRQAVADAIYECFRGQAEGARCIRRALFDYWESHELCRTRSLALLACAEERPSVFLSEYVRTARHALQSSLLPRHAPHFPIADRIDQVRGAAELAGEKLGTVAKVAWVHMRPGWLPARR